MKKYLKLMRVNHYIKNLLVFAALACSGQLFNREKFFICVMGFIAFCMVSSAVYVINDIRDAEKDRLHPMKCKRPIALGDISVRTAYALTVLLFAAAAVSVWLTHRYLPALLLLLYVLLNLAYSFGLKNIPIVDIIILVSGFLIRVIYGAIITDIVISNWLYLTVVAISFYFALGKRRNELKMVGHESRTVLKEYPLSFLDKSMNMCLTLANVFYALWSMDKTTMSAYKNKYLILTVPIVLIITMKYSLDIEGNSDGDPVEVLLSDRVLIVLCLLYFAVMFSVLYLK